MTYDRITLAKDQGLATLTLNAPEKLNAVSRKMIAEIKDCWETLAADSSVRAVVLTGAGRGFCSGLDLKNEMSSDRSMRTAGFRLFDLHNSPPVVLNRMDKPVICALNGAAAGYGMDLALGCDIRISSDLGKLAGVPVRRGVLPESGGTWYLPRLVGWAKACEIGFMADDIDAERALALGLVNAVVPADRVLDEAHRWAAKIAANAPLAIRAMKRLYRHGLSEDFSSHSHHVLMQLLLLFRSQDFQEGMMSFMEKRPPKFSGS